MPTDHSVPDDASKWPVKILRGTFSESKRLKLKWRYWRRRIRVEFRPA